MAKTLICLTALVVSFFIAAPAPAQRYVSGATVYVPPVGPGVGNIKAGPVEIHPFAQVTETYSDNIYRNYGGRSSESDFITTLTPGIQLRLPVRRHSFQLDYRADINWFARKSETNFTSQVGGGAINLDFPGGLIIGLSDYYSDSVVPRKATETPGLSGAADPNRELPYNTNDLNARVRYRFLDRWAVEARYNNFDYRYKNSEDDSGTFNRNLFGGSLFFRFTPKIDALLEYNFSTVKYKTSSANDNQNHAAYLGLSFDPTSKMTGYLKLGWEEKKYDQDQPGRSNSFSTFSTLVDLAYNVSPYHIFTLNALRIITEDVDTNAPYTNTDFALGYRHIMAANEKIRLNVTAGYGKLEFERSTADADGSRKTRDDKKWYALAGIAYYFQPWLSAGLTYTYTRNDSNFINYDYYENRAILNVAAAF